MPKVEFLPAIITYMSSIITFLKSIKQRLPWLWNVVEFINGVLIRLFYGRSIVVAVSKSLNNNESPYVYRKLTAKDASLLVDFISHQPSGFDKFFKPHDFDLKTFKRVLKSGTYILIGAFDGDILVGYCFIRFFINKSAFRGKIVDKEYQGRGIAKQMGLIMSKVASNAGFRVYATISKDNVASLKSAKYGSTIEIIKELPDNYLYVEIKENK